MENPPIVNRVEKSGLITLDLESYYQPGERILIDIKDQLYQGLILKEKDFRAFLDSHDWTHYSGKYVAVTCSADAIIPIWAYMLLSSRLTPHANKLVFGSLEDLETLLFRETLRKADFSHLKDAKVIIKGCGNLPVPTSAYMELVQLLQPIASSIMYGEACSTVPVYKKKKEV